MHTAHNTAPQNQTELPTFPQAQAIAQTIVRQLGLVDYAPTFAAMRAFTHARTSQTADEIWLCQHPPVFTQGQAGKPQHVLSTGNIPIVATDRGGQITYHGPGQVVAYLLIDLHRASYFVKELVRRTEDAVMELLGTYGIQGQRVQGAPGVYVAMAMAVSKSSPVPQTAPPAQPNFAGLGKIAALGLKVHKGCSYHGVALNVAMDLAPFHHINPCGYAGLSVTDMAACGVSLQDTTAFSALENKFAAILMKKLSTG